METIEDILKALCLTIREGQSRETIIPNADTKLCVRSPKGGLTRIVAWRISPGSNMAEYIVADELVNGYEYQDE